MLINDESRARVLLKRKMWALNRSDEELAIPASNDETNETKAFCVGLFLLLQTIELITDVTDGKKDVDPPPPDRKSDPKSCLRLVLNRKW